MASNDVSTFNSCAGMVDKKQLSELLLRVFYSLEDTVCRLVFKHLTTEDILTLLAAFPSLRKIVKDEKVLRWLCCHSATARMLQIEDFSALTLSEFIRVYNWYTHSDPCKRLSNEYRVVEINVTTLHHRVKQIIPRLIHSYFRFPLDPAPKKQILACCFLKPGSEEPFANALIISVKDDCSVKVYCLEKNAYKAKASVPMLNDVVALASSPKGKCVLVLEKTNQVSLLVFEEGLVSLVKTGIVLPSYKIRTDTFVSESCFIVTQPAGEENWKRVNAEQGWWEPTDKIWLCKLVKKDNIVTSSGQQVDRFKCIMMMLYLTCPTLSAQTLTARLTDIKKATEETPIDCLFYTGRCEISWHCACRLTMVEDPQNLRGKKRVWRTNFTDAIVCATALSPDRKTLYISVADIEEPAHERYHDEQLVEVSPSNPLHAVKHTWTKTSWYPMFTIIYKLDLDQQGEKRRMVPIYWCKTANLNLYNRFISPQDFYITFAPRFASNSLLLVGDIYMLSRMPGQPAYIVLPGNIWNMRKNDPLVMDLGEGERLIDATVDLTYIATFEKEIVAGKTPHHAFVLKRCPCSDPYTIEEATRPRKKRRIELK
jgi:hypothetical protein